LRGAIGDGAVGGAAVGLLDRARLGGSLGGQLGRQIALLLLPLPDLDIGGLGGGLGDSDDRIPFVGHRVGRQLVRAVLDLLGGLGLGLQLVEQVLGAGGLRRGFVVADPGIAL